MTNCSCLLRWIFVTGGLLAWGCGSDGAAVDLSNPLIDPDDGPAGVPDGECEVPAQARPADASNPTTVVGDGSPQSCVADAFVEAVARGGVITFDCGPEPTTIELDRPAKVFNDTGPEIVIDGGGLVTLSGGGSTRILYMNTCDEAQVWTTPHCDNQDHPNLTVQNISFANGNAKGEGNGDGLTDGGGAIWVRGGRFRLINTRFFNNVCDDVGPDVGGAVRVFSQYDGEPVYVVNTTFGGADGFGNTCSNGGGVSSIGVSWSIYNSVFSHNRAIGHGSNPAQPGTPGGGSGGAIYNDGARMTLSICGSTIEHNEVNSHGSAIFFVSNDHTGDIRIDRSRITNNVGGTWYPTYPQISNHDDTPIVVTDSLIE
ncbi:MAG: iron-containing alcohol dehydrogenase [Myxococcales bacterium FL481]|nr:MAG: iron-containing alcohol dehydrogenase [Myxococcales bacterium FL481]